MENRDNVVSLTQYKVDKEAEKQKEDDKQRFTYEAYFFFDDDYINEPDTNDKD